MIKMIIFNIPTVRSCKLLYQIIISKNTKVLTWIEWIFNLLNNLWYLLFTIGSIFCMLLFCLALRALLGFDFATLQAAAGVFGLIFLKSPNCLLYSTGFSISFSFWDISLYFIIKFLLFWINFWSFWNIWTAFYILKVRFSVVKSGYLFILFSGKWGNSNLIV